MPKPASAATADTGLLGRTSRRRRPWWWADLTALTPAASTSRLATGSVQFVSESIALETLQQLAHRADGKLLSGEY